VAMGRPRAFDMDKALDQALLLFWEKGYEGTSVADLTEAMGINPPSLYAAFGNKEALFKKALDRYETVRDQIMEEAFAVPTAREAMTRLLEGTAERLSDKRNPSGCLMVQGALAGSEECEAVKRDLALRRAAGEVLVRERLKRGKRGGDLCPTMRIRRRSPALWQQSCKAWRFRRPEGRAAKNCGRSSTPH
jgi:AcrR family transcriptional regulator